MHSYKLLLCVKISVHFSNQFSNGLSQFISTPLYIFLNLINECRCVADASQLTFRYSFHFNLLQNSVSFLIDVVIYSWYCKISLSFLMTCIPVVRCHRVRCFCCCTMGSHKSYVICTLMSTGHRFQPWFVECGTHVYSRQIWCRTFDAMRHGSSQLPSTIGTLQNQWTTAIALEKYYKRNRCEFFSQCILVEGNFAGKKMSIYISIICCLNEHGMLCQLRAQLNWKKT